MNQLKQILCMCIMCISMFAHAQENNKGIHWTTGLSWEQIKQKAKADNKFIFVDAFATWCGPCRAMDQSVYLNDTVGDFVNKNFIAVKVQMDKTKKDNDQVQSWYRDADIINETYHVEGYPSFIFLNPEGIVTDHQMGYKGVNAFITMALAAIQPEKVYNDPYAEFNKLLSSYKQGSRDYEKYPLMIDMANKIHEDSICTELLKELTEYILTLKRKDRYTKERIYTWSKFSFSSNNEIFQFFYKDRKLIDKVINQKGYSNVVIDKTIQSEVVDSFFKMQKGETITINGYRIPNSEIMFARLPIRADGKIVPDYAEADWNQLKKMVKKKFTREDAERNVLKARIRWYGQHQNMEAASKFKLELMNKFWTNDTKINISEVNNDGFNAFLYSTDRMVINGFINWLEKAGIRKSERAGNIDTYANLLYKIGRVNEAISWEEKASQLAPSDNDFKKAISDMKGGRPTYGAVWLVNK